MRYALVRRGPQGLTYVCAVPSAQLYPDHFQIYCIPKEEYLRVEYHGDMAGPPETIDRISKQELKDRRLAPVEGVLVYPKKYNEWLHYRQDTSVIELYIPLAGSAYESMEEIEVKIVLQGGGNTIEQFSWFDMDFNMNPHKGCNHGCIYCDSRGSCYQVQESNRVRKKKNEPSIPERQLKGKRKKGMIDIGATSGTYNPSEKQQKVTRDALQLIDRYGYGVGIDTKSTLVLRDLDLLARIASHSPVIVKLTITYADDALGKTIEPYAPNPSERSLILEELHRAGIYVGISMVPILPFTNDTPENVTGIIELAAKHHTKFVHLALDMTPRDNQKDYCYYQLDHYLLGKRGLYEQHYRNVYSYDSPHAARLYKLFQTRCREYSIRCRMDDIVRGYKKQQVRQGQLELQGDTDAISTAN